MNLELLPNEILLDIFDYIGGIYLLPAFYGLNSYFNLLLYKQFRAYRFNFFFISKCKFDMICQHHLPFIADRVIYLSLCDRNETPGQINLFFSYIPSIAQFTHLQSLKLFNLCSHSILIKIVDQFHHLCNLTRLYLDAYNCQNDKADFQLIVNNIWSLPKLTYCYLDVGINKEENFCLPTKLSTSLKDLYMYRYNLTYNQICKLFEYTSYLKHLSISFDSDTNEDYKPSHFFMLTNLSIYAYRLSDTSKIISFLQNVPNLRRLNVHLSFNTIDGYQWKQLIQNYLPKMKVFTLMMKDKYPVDQNIQERADELINSFRSSFWIDEHKWFVRCAVYNKTIYLETLSKIYRTLERNFPDSWKSTYPYDDHEKFYNTKRSIYFDTFFDKPIPSFICLQNIELLHIKLPISDKFFSIVPNLERLKSLIVSSNDDSFQSQLQILFDRAPHLRHLYFSTNLSLPLQMSLFKYKSSSVRELYLQESNHQFNEEECMALTRSPMGVQCEQLSIQVKNRESIIILVQNMINLKALHVKQLSLTENNIANRNEVIQWLKDRLPSTCLIGEDPDSISCIRIWIK